jgi:hypothetical protein
MYIYIIWIEFYNKIQFNKNTFVSIKAKKQNY